MIIAISGKKGHGKDLVGSIIQYLTTPEGSNEFTLEDYINDSSSYLYNGNNWEVKRFADKLKDMVCLLLGCTREQLEDREFKDKELREEWWYYEVWKSSGEDDFDIVYLPYINHVIESDAILVKLTPRRILQLLGTEAGRNIIHPNIWVNALMSEYKATTKIAENKDSMNWTATVGEVIFPNWIITDMRFPNELQAVKKRKGISIRVSRHTVGADDLKPEDLHESETALDNAEFEHVILNDGTIEDLIIKVKNILIKEGIIKP